MTDLRQNSMTGEQWVFEERSADPATTEEGERWLRTDLNSGDKIATLRVDVGSIIHDVPIFATGTAVDAVSEAMRIQVNGVTGYVPIAPVSDAAFPELRMQHNSEVHGYHNRVEPVFPIPDSGVSRWEFEQDVTDSWGTYDGTDNTSAGYSTNSAVGTYSKEFDGTNDYIDTPLALNFGTSTFSLSVWVNQNDTEENNFFSTYDGSTGILLENDPSSGYEFFFDGNNILARTSVSGSWEHVVAVRESSTMRIYVNSVEEASTNDDPDVSSTEDLDIGRRTTNEYYMDGLLDDPRVYDKALTSTEVSNLYNSGSISG